MTDYEKIVRNWMNDGTGKPYTGYINPEIIDLCRRVAQEQIDLDIAILEKEIVRGNAIKAIRAQKESKP